MPMSALRRDCENMLGTPIWLQPSDRPLTILRHRQMAVKNFGRDLVA